jgi:hypothetical protein
VSCVWSPSFDFSSSSFSSSFQKVPSRVYLLWCGYPLSVSPKVAWSSFWIYWEVMDSAGGGA